MGCYHPILMLKSVSPDGELISKWTGIKYNPNNLDWEKSVGYDCVPVPCGSCVGCRLDRSRTWADRCMIELDHSKKAVFVTLTYNNENVPWNYSHDMLSLRYKDLQDFFKRLIDHISRIDSSIVIRRYAAGEYGDLTFRPHYHAIIFGIDLNFFPDLREVGKNDFFQSLYTSEWLEKIWSKGHVCIANCSWQACAYTARYTAKKHMGKDAFFYDVYGIQPEKALMSNRPGIAGFFFEDHSDLILNDDCLNHITIKDLDGVRQVKDVSLPLYLLNKLSIENPEKYAMIKERRREFAEDKALIELSKTDLDFVHYNEVKETVKLEQIKALKKVKI